MNLAVMQPYFFPYIGYFQLIREVDAFVIYDDVNYIKGGWINRNYILANGNSQRVTLPLKGASPNKLINQIEVAEGNKILQSVRQSYGRAPHFQAAFPLIEKILSQAEKNLAYFLYYQLRLLCEYLELNPQWYFSSKLEKDRELRGQKKILAICEELGATCYTNLPGGKALYDEEVFAAREIKLSFIQPQTLSYQQFDKKFISQLSIIDMLMFNDVEECKKLLSSYHVL